MTKRLFLLLLVAFLVCTDTIANTKCPHFLGIPVDGPKLEMIQKLEAKGYTYNEEEDYLTGFYFGSPVYIFVQTVNGEVSRIIVYDIPQRNEEDIRHRFNAVYTMFDQSMRYRVMGKKDARIIEKESISREMRQHNKFYKAVFKQVKESSEDSLKIQQACQIPNGQSPLDMQLLNQSYHERRRRIHAKALAYINLHEDYRENNLVWFGISERFGKYALIMFYDNLKNLTGERQAMR